jgi:hypothetical protein
MKIFFDFEMTGLHQNTTPISLGMVTEDGQQFYTEFMDYDKTQVTPWIQEHVIDKLSFDASYNTPIAWGALHTVKFTMIGFHQGISNMMAEWFRQFDQVEMWGDVLAYDWVLFCEMFPIVYDSAERLPSNIYYIPFDIATLAKLKGIDPDFDRKEFSGNAGEKHNALVDAFTIMACYDRLMLMEDVK